VQTSLDGWLVDLPWMASAECAGEPLEQFWSESWSESSLHVRALSAWAPYETAGHGT
jgi:hypothetical protein